jgi:hypothetical protein
LGKTPIETRKSESGSIGMVFPLQAENKLTFMITLNDFREASYEKKCDLVTHSSNYIANRILADCKVYLYHTGDFFIEVYYSPNYQSVLMIHAFNDANGLQPYIDGFSLAELGV